MPISKPTINPPSFDIKSEDVSIAAADKLEIKQVSHRPSIKKRLLSLLKSIRLKPRSKNDKKMSVANKPPQLAKPAQVAAMAVKAPGQNVDPNSALLQAIRNGVDLRPVTVDQKVRPVTINSDRPFLQEIANSPVLKKIQDARVGLSSQSAVPVTVQAEIQPQATLAVTSDTLPPPPPPPPLPSLVQNQPVNVMAGMTAQSDAGKNALLNAITGFNKSNLKKATVENKTAESQVPAAKQELVDALYSDELLKTAPGMDGAVRAELCAQMSDHIVSAMEVDWEKMLLDQYGSYKDISTLETAMKGQAESIASYWAEVKRFPDLWKQADVVSDQPSQAERKGVVAVAMNRLNAGKNGVFGSDNTRGAKEMKKGEAILESARRLANQHVTSDEKLHLLGNNYRQAALNVLTEMPFMEGFVAKNGKDALAKLEKQFMASIHGVDSLKTDVSTFLATHMQNGFADFTFSGQEALVIKQAALINELQLKLGLL
ncbi:WH2 domain-containing protein [Shewanella sp. CG12_big_fil_rev_8_21_14_0_65_47_15]|uniref:WH2 domain-containing protein n=1 Tax=Shewanella sp. CG12_big_fil_rev_8_21_14_0_65_47_15 TaxID=1975537 RepID=UPI000CC607C3|nr:WH2 domain-containing protein [Shewanella sp. CG12_big_fil_rev_8_21_14_0_65_47_15]PIW62240.1 MAG: actin-binding protein [Shewanella sp. CG12_big_fil_rev_8_21_14_0_65_47_15]